MRTVLLRGPQQRHLLLEGHRRLRMGLALCLMFEIGAISEEVENADHDLVVGYISGELAGTSQDVLSRLQEIPAEVLGMTLYRGHVDLGNRLRCVERIGSLPLRVSLASSETPVLPVEGLQ